MLGEAAHLDVDKMPEAELEGTHVVRGEHDGDRPLHRQLQHEEVRSLHLVYVLGGLLCLGLAVKQCLHHTLSWKQGGSVLLLVHTAALSSAKITCLYIMVSKHDLLTAATVTVCSQDCKEKGYTPSGGL